MKEAFDEGRVGSMGGAEEKWTEWGKSSMEGMVKFYPFYIGY